MKIPASIRQIYEDQKAVNDHLRTVVDERMRGLRKARWHYESRVKELASFALKIESGRFKEPTALEDFFACTLVVANATEIAEAENLVCGNFMLRQRRPHSSEHTHKASDAFPFDDLRLYVALADTPVTPPTDPTGVVFEVQIKTFLQHAWSIATHDLLYKTDSADWSKERIAYQIKAMLEHAEVSILESERLAASSSLAKEDRRTAAIKSGIALVKKQWGADELPTDVRRLADNITSLMEALRLEVGRLEEILNQGKANRHGSHPTNLSPYATVVQYLLRTERERMFRLLSAKDSRKRVLIPDEVELPADMDRAQLRNAVFVGSGMPVSGSAGDQ